MSLGSIARRTGLYDVLEPFYSRYQCWRWVGSTGQGPPPSAVKRAVMRQTARQYSLDTLVETGTYRGDTVRALRSGFGTIYSIELDDGLYELAIRRCRNQQNARLLGGDSADLLPQVLAELSGPTLFWLDAHWSGPGTATSAVETPISVELRAILADAPLGSVVLIDDHREFVRGATDYPSADSIRQSALSAGYTFTVKDDIMRLHPATG